MDFDYNKQVVVFLNEVNKVGLSKNRRLMILLLGIYSEYLVNELLKVILFKFNFGDKVSQSVKLKILLSDSVLDNKTYMIFSKLNQVRNEYAHNLVVNSEKIEKWASEVPLNWKMEKGSMRKVEAILKKNPLDRFQKICITNIIFLFQRLKVLSLEKNNS